MKQQKLLFWLHIIHISVLDKYRGILIFQRQIFYSETPLISFTFHYIQELGMINRLEFCQWLQQLEVDEFFFNKMLFTDESTFTNHG